MTSKLFWMAVGPNPAEPSQEGLKADSRVFELSLPAIFAQSAATILNEDLGFRASAEEGGSVLGDGRPIPMMSYSLVEYLMGLDVSACDVLELGGGYSTLFWSCRARSVHTLEHDRDWGAMILGRGLTNLSVSMVASDGYVAAVRGLDRLYDIIVVDCASNRFEPTRAVIEKLQPGGFVILDNSDWYPNSAALLRAADLVQVDFSDFRPSHHYRCTASLFLHRQFRPKPAAGRLPAVPIGGKDQASANPWDHPLP